MIIAAITVLAAIWVVTALLSLIASMFGLDRFDEDEFTNKKKGD